MKITISSLILIGFLSLGVSGRVIFRHKRQLEVEGDPASSNPNSDVVIIRDINTNSNGPSYTLIPVIPTSSSNSDRDIVDLDINEDDGTFTLGGRLPSFHHHHHNHDFGQSFIQMFQTIQQRFDEMARRMAESFVNTNLGSMNPDSLSPGSSLSPSESNPETDISSLPENYNNTKTEVITINGRQFLKKTTMIKKELSGSTIFISSTTYEPVNETENEAENPARPENESPVKSDNETPVGSDNSPAESQPASSTTSATTTTTTTMATTAASELEREEMTSPASNPV